MNNHTETIKEEFTKQAHYFETVGLTLSNQKYLEWIVKSLPLKKSFHVLDVAAGTALLSRAISKFTKEVTAIDTTFGMLDVAKKEIEKSNISNITLKEGLAESLPFKDSFFDMVVSRFAIHHFESPQICIDEMSRVCKKGHVVGIIDLLSPNDTILAERYNHYEILRDPSHIIAATKSELREMMGKSDLSICFENAREIEVDLQKWMDMTETDIETQELIIENIQQELSGGEQTGLRPFIMDGRIRFMQTWAIIMGEKTLSEDATPND